MRGPKAVNLDAAGKHMWSGVMKRIKNYLAESWPGKGNFWNFFVIWIVLANSIWFSLFINGTFEYSVPIIGTIFLYTYGLIPRIFVAIAYFIYFPISIFFLFLVTLRQKRVSEGLGPLVSIIALKTFGILVSEVLMVGYLLFTLLALFSIGHVLYWISYNI